MTLPRHTWCVLVDLVTHLLHQPITDADDLADWCAEEAAYCRDRRWRDRVLAVGVALDSGAAPDLAGLRVAWAELVGEVW